MQTTISLEYYYGPEIYSLVSAWVHHCRAAVGRTGTSSSDGHQQPAEWRHERFTDRAGGLYFQRAGGPERDYGDILLDQPAGELSDHFRLEQQQQSTDLHGDAGFSDRTEHSLAG